MKSNTPFRLIPALLAVVSLLPGVLRAEGPRKVDDLAGRRVLVLGDSITQGGDYVSFIEYYLAKLYPEKNFDLVSIGLASETVSGQSEQGHPFPRPCVFERLERALDKVKPQTVVACYGMNDGIYHPQSPERMKAYQDGILRLVRDAMAKGATSVILVTPPLFDARAFGNNVMKDGDPWKYFRPYYKYEDVLQDYSRWLMTIRMPGVTSVDLHTPMAAALAERCKKDAGFKFAGDGIHPSPLGHLVMAQAVLRGLGVQIPAGDLDAELARIQADPLYKLVNQHRRLRSDNWLPYVGYTRGGTFNKASIDDTEKAATELQKRIDALRRPAK